MSDLTGIDVKLQQQIVDLMACADREDDIVSVNPFISAIHAIAGGKVAAGVFKKWCDERGIVIYKERPSTNRPGH